ncbi:MAG: hypothetical protein M3033_04070 [Acidobacteriota bacterium]|nr:hypothetical protein [Acidobacteriota bacterium]
MKKRCPNCNLVNFPHAKTCVRCAFDLAGVPSFQESDTIKVPLKSKIIKRALVCLAVCLFTIVGFYLSMIFTSSSLSREEKATVERSIKILDEKGFSREVFLLEHLTVYRANDNWLNASTREENAYAATNFPLEIMTIYPEFFTVPVDDTERAAILLHEAQHLKGADEKQAYEFTWRNRKKLGWTRNIYLGSVIWRNVRKQTREYAPNLFGCDWTEYNDCTE